MKGIGIEVMIFEYFGHKVRVQTHCVELIDVIKKRYFPIVKIYDEYDNFDYDIELSVRPDLIDRFIPTDCRRIIIHGGKRKEYYVTGLEKIAHNEKIIFIENLRSLVKVELKNKRIYCSGPDINNLTKAFELIIIELFYRSRENEKGSFHFHASAVADKSNNAILFIGKKNAGKSTFLTESIINHQMKYICNDNCFVELNNDELVVVPWFEDIKLKTKTIEKYNINISEIEKCEHTYDNSKKFIPLSVMQNSIGFEINFASKLSKIVLLEYNQTYSSITRGWTDKSYNDIVDNTMLPHDSEHYEFLGIFDEFDTNRFDLYDSLVEVMRAKTEFIKLTYSESNFEIMYKKLFEEG